MSHRPIDTHRLVRETFVARVEHHRQVESTNDCARQRAAGDPGPLPLLIVADMQTAGRGRGANRWWTGRGSLAVSLLLDAPELGIDRARSPLVALAAAVAVAETAALRLPSHAVGVHWPNDVYVGSRKLAGILVEVLSRRFLVVGIGLNANNAMTDAPGELRNTATTLLELTGTRHDPTDLLLELLERLAELLGRLRSAPGEVAARADALCLQRGQTLTVQSARESITGRCAGIAPDGALLLETHEGRRTVYSGVVS